MKNNIFDEIDRLKHDYQDLKAEIKELNETINKSDVSNSRKRGVYTSAGTTCEAILKYIYQKQTSNGKPINKLMLDELITKLSDFLPAQVIINFRTIQAWRNLGTHDKDDMRNVDNNSLIMVDMALTNIVEWFFTSYLKIENLNDISTLNDAAQKATIVNENKISISKDKTALKTVSSEEYRTLLADIATELQMNYSELGDKNEIERRIKSSNSQKLAYLFVELKELAKHDHNFQRFLEVQKSVTEYDKTTETNNKPISDDGYPKNKSLGITCYSELTIRNQIWMQDNLAVCEFSNGDPINQAKTNDDWLNAGINAEPAWCYYKSNAKENNTIGLLYNWFAVIDPRGLAPKGWRIPNNNDYENLITHLGGEWAAANSLKKINGWKGLARRKSTGKYVGYSRDGQPKKNEESAINYGSNYAWWCSSAGKGKTFGSCFEFISDKFSQSSYPKGTGFPVVCIKDTLTNANPTLNLEKPTKASNDINKSVADELDDLLNGLNF